MNGKKQDIVFMAGDCAVSGNTMFYLIRDMNLVCKKKIDTGEMELYRGIPEGKGFGYQLASRIMIWGEELVFTPRGAKAIWISDLDLNNWEKVEYEAVPKGCHAEYATLQAFFYENRLYIIGSDYPAIMCLESDRKLTYIRKPYQRFMPRIDTMREFFFRKAYAIQNNILYLASCRDNYVLKLWLDTYVYEWIEVGGKGNRYSGIAFDGEYFWLAPRCSDSRIVKWDGGKMTEEIALWGDFKKSRRPFLGVLNIGKGVLFPGYEQRYSLFISQQGKIETVEGQYVFYKELDEGEFLAQHIDGTLLHIFQNKREQDVTCIVQKDAILRLVEKNIDDFGYLFCEPRVEDDVIGLEEMVKLAVKSGIHRPQPVKEDCGKRIWMSIPKGHPVMHE